MFPADPNELMNITLKDGAVTREFRIKRGYLDRPQDGAVRNLIVLNVSYPDMGLPPPWQQDQLHKRMSIYIQGAVGLGHGQTLVNDWNARGQQPNLGPGFKRFVGQQNGYDTYESLPSPKTDQVFRTQVFTDPYGQLVSVDYSYDYKHIDNRARIFGDIDIRYGLTTKYEERTNDPRQVRNLVDNFVRQLVVPPQPLRQPIPSINPAPPILKD